MDQHEINPDFFQEFEKGFNPRFPHKSSIPVRILGYGEISTVLEILTEGMENLACKRMPMFKSEREIENYLGVYEEYLQVLEHQVGINLVPGKTLWITEAKSGRGILYILQEKHPPGTIGHHAIHKLSDKDVFKLVKAVLRELKKIFDFNREHHGEIELGLDGQISNWAILNFNPDNPVLADPLELTYFDTSTPLMLKNGQEQLDPLLFLRSAPSFLVWIIRLLFLEDVMTRYYDFRRVTVDLIANFYKEQRSELIPSLIEISNGVLSSQPSDEIFKPITIKEVSGYYREDATIWRFYLASRKVDRGLHGLLGRSYPYVLPEKVQR